MTYETQRLLRLRLTGTRYRGNMSRLVMMQPAANMEKRAAVLRMPGIVAGGQPSETGPDMKTLNRIGCSTYATRTTAMIPKIDIAAIDLKAGCPANIRAPMPTSIVNAEKKIAVL